MKRGYLLVNFGGPRDLDEVTPFLKELLCDRDVVRSGLPSFVHNFLFSCIAKRRAKRICQEYTHIGGKSPIYDDTEQLADSLRKSLKGPLWTFHRYLPLSHQAFFDQFKLMQAMDEILVIPLFPQMSYATTGSIARFFQTKMPRDLWQKLRWIPSYPTYPGFIEAYKEKIEESLKNLAWQENEVAVLASFHGIPQSFVDRGDPYLGECERSFKAIQPHFPGIVWKMSFQSKFGPGEWIKPYTEQVCQDPHWTQGRRKILIVPLAFTSDHIETLSEIENQYIPLLKAAGFEAKRVSALNSSSKFVDALTFLIQSYESDSKAIANQFLVASYCSFPKLCLRFGTCACVKSS